MAVCAAIKKNGQPCTNTILPPGASRCFAHNPDLQAERAQARKRGGASKANYQRITRLLPASLKPTLAALFTALEEVHRGELDPKQGQAMAALASAITRMYTIGQLEERVSALESKQATYSGTGRLPA